jgi:formamidopyrimidine-DNA glycosylase
MIENLGLEPLSREFTPDMLENLLKSERKQLKRLLCRQSKIAGIGNAYADEILWKAGLSPFKISTNLSKRETEKLYEAIISVLSWAIQQVMCLKRIEKRDFLQIHGRKGHLCPRCRDKIRVVSFSQGDTYYCATCQTGGHKLKDRRMSKFYR